MRCLDNKLGKCGAYGDPHVYTFDGAQNDVYGVANYTFTRVNSSDDIQWSITMETAPIGKVSRLESFTLNVTSEAFNYTVKTTFDSKAEYFYNFADRRFIRTDADFESYIRLQITPDNVALTTNFGLIIQQSRARGEVFVPYMFSGQLEGLCGNYDFDPSNDFKCPNGTVWPYTADRTFQRSTSEFETAKCWKEDGEDGPHPDEINKEPCEAAEICDKLFDNPIFSSCKKYIDPFPLIESCKVDYCQEESAETLKDIYATFMRKCADLLPEDEGVCTWRNVIGMNECPANSVWSGCASQCDAQKSCSGVGNCNENVLLEGCFCKEGYVLSATGECIEPASCSSDWGEWGPCTVSCGRGTRTRSGFSKGEVDYQEGICNTNDCPFDPAEKPECSCPNNQWSCQGECPISQSCQRVSQNDMRCLENKNGKCGAYGDPHVYTFDGAQNDVYGVANYTLSQYNSTFTDFDDLQWSVTMETAPIGKVSRLNALTLNVQTANYTYQIKTAYTKTAQDWSTSINYSYNFTDGSVDNDACFKKLVQVQILNRKVTYKTEFGVTIVQHGYSGEIFVPYAFSEKLEGLCGNYDYNKTNDFMCPDGTVWPFDAGNTYDRTTSEFETAKCWKINGEDGPHPDDINRKSCEAISVCDNLFENPIFDNCTQLIDPTPFIDACKTDYCQVQTQQTLEDIYATFVQKCADILPEDVAVCTWRQVLDMDSCPRNSAWSGCKAQCGSRKSCKGPGTCDEGILTEGCFCKPGFVLSDNGRCIARTRCGLYWAEWTTCASNSEVPVDTYDLPAEDSCKGTRTRVGYIEAEEISQERDCVIDSEDCDQDYYDYYNYY